MVVENSEGKDTLSAAVVDGSGLETARIDGEECSVVGCCEEELDCLRSYVVGWQRVGLWTRWVVSIKKA